MPRSSKSKASATGIAKSAAGQARALANKTRVKKAKKAKKAKTAATTAATKAQKAQVFRTQAARARAKYTH